MQIKKLLDAQRGILQIQAVNIHGYRKRYELFRLCKEVRAKLEWYAEEEKKLIRAYGGEVEASGIRFPDSAKRTAFEAQRDELGLTEVDLDVPLPVQLREADLAGEALPVETMLCLDGLVEFVEVDYGG